jgi:uncharacterized protein (TIGR02246 family)
MRRIVSLTILIVFAGAFLSASAQRRPISTKFDEYGAINSEELMARLDNFTVQLQHQPGSTAYILAYAPEEGAKRILESAKDYLVNARGLPADRITTVYGGRNNVLSEPRVQLWIAPPGAPRPRPRKFKSNVETFRGLFSEKRAYDFNPAEPLTEEESKKLKFPVPAIDESSGWPSGSDVTHASLAEVLKEQKTAVAYIVGYNGEDSAPGAWKRITQRNFQELKELGVEASRLELVYGGNQKEAKVQLWVTTAGAPPPVKDAGPEQLPSKAVSIASHVDDELGYSGVERQAFKQIAELLRQFPTARACVVVTFGTYEDTPESMEPSRVEPEEPSEPEQSTTPEVESEPEPADVAKLVEKWKDELAGKYKIGADRFVVLFSRTDGFSNNMLETWVVPPGAELPSPEGDPSPENPSTTDEEEIRKVLASFIEAWNKHDAKAFSMVFAEDADFTNVRGTSAHGRAEVEKFHAPLFATRFKDTNQKMTQIKIRFIKPDVAAVDAWWEMTGAKGADGQDMALRKGLLNFIMTKEGDKWLIKVMHNMDLPVSP